MACHPQHETSKVLGIPCCLLMASSQDVRAGTYSVMDSNIVWKHQSRLQQQEEGNIKCTLTSTNTSTFARLEEMLVTLPIGTPRICTLVILLIAGQNVHNLIHFGVSAYSYTVLPLALSRHTRPANSTPLVAVHRWRCQSTEIAHF